MTRDEMGVFFASFSAQGSHLREQDEERKGKKV